MKAKDEREAFENARIAAAVAEADTRAEEAAHKLAEMRRKMQQDCNQVGHYSASGLSKTVGQIPILWLICCS